MASAGGPATPARNRRLGRRARPPQGRVRFLFRWRGCSARRLAGGVDGTSAAAARAGEAVCAGYVHARPGPSGHGHDSAAFKRVSSLRRCSSEDRRSRCRRGGCRERRIGRPDTAGARCLRGRSRCGSRQTAWKSLVQPQGSQAVSLGHAWSSNDPCAVFFSLFPSVSPGRAGF